MTHAFSGSGCGRRSERVPPAARSKTGCRGARCKPRPACDVVLRVGIHAVRLCRLPSLGAIGMRLDRLLPPARQQCRRGEPTPLAPTVPGVETLSSDDADLSPLVGNNLRRLRTCRGHSLERLAKLSGVSRAMLGQIELGRSVPTITLLWRSRPPGWWELGCGLRWPWVMRLVV